MVIILAVRFLRILVTVSDVLFAYRFVISGLACPRIFAPHPLAHPGPKVDTPGNDELHCSNLLNTSIGTGFTPYSIEIFIGLRLAIGAHKNKGWRGYGQCL